MSGELERRGADGHAGEVEAAAPYHEKPEDWGWHWEAGRAARLAGWVTVACLLVMNIGNHTRHTEDIWLAALAVLLVVILLADRRRRKNAWRE